MKQFININASFFLLISFVIISCLSLVSCKSCDYSIFDENPYSMLEYKILSIEDYGSYDVIKAKRKGWALYVLSYKKQSIKIDDYISEGKTAKLCLKTVFPIANSVPGSRLHVSGFSLSNGRLIKLNPNKDLGVFEAINLNGRYITPISTEALPECDTTNVRFVF